MLLRANLQVAQQSAPEPSLSFLFSKGLMVGPQSSQPGAGPARHLFLKGFICLLLLLFPTLVSFSQLSLH